MIPLGLLQDAHYSAHIPTYLNLASLGLTLAHEALHSLDEAGREFDFRGNLDPRWWQGAQAQYK